MTKTLLTIIILFCAYITTNAQRVTYNDLLYVYNHDIGDVEDYLSSNGFNFGSVDTIGEYQQVNYNFSKYSSKSLDYISINKSSIDSVFFQVSFFTVQQSDYIKLKSEIKNVGYKLIGNKVYNGRLNIDYKKDDLTLSFMLSKNADGINMYYITLSNEIRERLLMYMHKKKE